MIAIKYCHVLLNNHWMFPLIMTKNKVSTSTSEQTHKHRNKPCNLLQAYVHVMQETAC